MRAINNEPKGAIDLGKVLRKALSNTRDIGQSTACIATLGDKYIHAVNIGDSSFMVVRKGRAYFHSPVQQHALDWPYQLGSDPNSDPPSLAVDLKFHLAPGDVIVAGTKLFNNLFGNEVVGAILHRNNDGLGPQKMASMIAILAQKRARGNDVTPFSVAARKARWTIIGTIIVANVSWADVSDRSEMSTCRTTS
ncbi:putative protein phosphatase 2C 55 [Cinnamomum micranthum f. kanehirae]|uniref:Protein phosphatase n=1 Tax=Cinnamomum micranthum f. kanehirae TaxID=337451 RepID=A0A3S4P6V9_9MAGN|nr:putative protein phosphatase 2C 55 [Cinnamomum micranthum f. kanehirae]